MRKLRIISALLLIVLLLSTVSFALNEELLVNPNFEKGTTEGFEKYAGDCTAQVSRSYGRNNSYGLLITNRKEKYSTYAQTVTNTLNTQGPGTYTVSMWIRLKDNSQGSAKCQLVLNILPTYSTEHDYYVSPKTELTTSWKQHTFTVILPYSKGEIADAKVYQQSFLDDSAPPDVMVDDFSMKKTKEFTGSTITDVSNIKRSSTTSVGAIRWDAWYSHDGKSNSVVSQVERSLSPAKFHFRAPFFANITSSGKIEMPQYTQEIFDREMEYAKYAGLDYFAYVWYNTDMKAARIFHTKSKYRKDVKMCVCFDGNAIAKDFAREEMRTLLKADYYMTVLDGRPLMYYLASSATMSLVLSDIAYYKNLAKEIGVPEPYAVIMNMGVSGAKTVGADAVSNYAVVATTTYSDVTKNAYAEWEGNNSSNYQYIPTLSFGWHPEPRYINQVSWTTVGANSWATYATDRELLDHVAYALSYMSHSSSAQLTKANTMLIYAWNEHDEGGWICPTLEVDANGKQLYNSDGTKKLNENHLNALKLAIDYHKAGNRVSVSINGKSNGSTIKSASSIINNVDTLLSKNVYEGVAYGSNKTPTASPIVTAKPTQQAQKTPTSTSPAQQTAVPQGPTPTANPQATDPQATDPQISAPTVTDPSASQVPESTDTSDSVTPVPTNSGSNPLTDTDGDGSFNLMLIIIPVAIAVVAIVLIIIIKKSKKPE